MRKLFRESCECEARLDADCAGDEEALLETRQNMVTCTIGYNLMSGILGPADPDYELLGRVEPY